MADSNELEKFKNNFISLQLKHIKKGFKAHLISYICMNVAFLIINFTVTPDKHWSLFSIAGWGLGVIIHYLSQVLPAEKIQNRLAEEAMSL